MKVFVSSACYDLVDLRAELFEELRELGVEPHFSDIKESGFVVPSEPTVNSVEACLADLRECELVIFILSQRYGPALKGQFGDKSATQCEYDEAKRLKMRSLFYVRTDLWGDFSAWRKSKHKDDFRGLWAQQSQMSARSSTTVTALAKASEGLLYPSETDAPFEPFRWPATGSELSPAQVARLAHKKGTVEEVPAADFFAELTSGDDGDRFQALQAAICESLTHICVFRIGKTKIHIYLVGQDKQGDWVGLHTVSVET